MDTDIRKLKLDELNRVNISDYKDQKKFSIKLVLDNIRSGHNVGAAFRTADAFNIEEVILTGITPRPPHKEIFKSAIGATESVEWCYYGSTYEVLQKLKIDQYAIIGVEQTSHSHMLSSYDSRAEDKIAVVFGNEVNGISDEILPLLDLAIEVPQMGTKHSLNVSVCVGVVLWELVRNRIS